MNFLLISGPKSSGKTSLLFRQFNYYTTHGWAVVDHKLYRGDFRCILEKSGRKILIQSDTDLPGCIVELKKYQGLFPTVDVIVTSCRNLPDPMRNRLFSELKITITGNSFLEIPLGRMPSGTARIKAISWYLSVMENIAITAGASAPFYL